MKFITSKFIPWLMGLTRITRYLIIALLVHVALLAFLATRKIVTEVRGSLRVGFVGELPPAAQEPNLPSDMEGIRHLGITVTDQEPDAGVGSRLTPETTETAGTPFEGPLVIGPTGELGTDFRHTVSRSTDISITSPQSALLVPGKPSVMTQPGHEIYVKRVDPKAREDALKDGHGSPETERAVLMALRWLKSNQQPDGSWKMSSAPAGSALAVLAFLGHGETADSVEFGAAVQNGLGYLARLIGPDGQVPGRMYEQGLVALALAEGYALTGAPSLREPLEKIVGAILAAQRAEKARADHVGGWRYKPSSNDSDTSVSGWMVLALKSARNAGIAVPDESFERAAQYLWNMYGGPGFSYTERGTRPGTTAIGVLCMQFLGNGGDDRVKAALDYLREQKVDWQETRGDYLLYGWYYMTQAMYQGGEPYWTYWNGEIRDTLVRNQNQDGSWPFPAATKEDHHGPVYSTSLCALMLEVYYRYLPMYKLERGPQRLTPPTNYSVKQLTRR